MKRTKLTDGWKVYRDKDAFSLVYTLPADAVETQIPYDAMWHEPQQKDAVSAGRTSYLDGGVYHYYREMDFPESMRGEKIVLRMEGVFSKSYVYLNGSLAGQGDFGYVRYDCDLTDFIRFGEKNVLLVVAKTPALSSRWYSGGGIVRDVYLMEARDACIVPDSFFLKLADSAPEGAVLQVSASVRSLSSAAQDLKIVLELEQAGEKVFTRSFRMRLGAGKEQLLTHRVYVPGLKKWSAEEPDLYQCRLILTREENGQDTVVDEDAYETGFCDLSWDAARGLTVNGKTVKLRGGCVHHDQGMLGGTAFYDYEYRRVKKMKEAGFNAIRSAHNHASPALLSACDRLGVYVLDEVCDMWTKMKGYEDFTQYFGKSWQDTVDAMVLDDRRHPCVVGYSTGNEISDICTDKGIEMSHALYHRFKELDGTRFVTNGINGAFAAGDGLLEIAVDLTGRDPADFMDGDVNKFMGLMATKMAEITRHPVITGILDKLDSSMDIMGYNYMTARYASDAQTDPDRLMLGTETYPRQIAENWRLITAIPQCVGDFTWTGWDYLGELGETPEAYPQWNNTSGDLDSLGNRRPVSYYREIVFGLRTAPYVCVRPAEAFGTPRFFGPWKFTDAEESWNFDAAAFGENNPDHLTQVEVYARGSEAELFLNGRSLGRKPCGDGADYFAVFEVPYEPGVLCAVDCESGEQYTLQTVGAPGSLVLNVEKDLPAAQSEGLVFVEIGLRDGDGRKVPGSGQTLTIECEGAQLYAFGSLGQDHRAGFTIPEIRFTGDTALAILKKTAPEAEACVRVSCPEAGLSAESKL